MRIGAMTNVYAARLLVAGLAAAGLSGCGGGDASSSAAASKATVSATPAAASGSDTDAASAPVTRGGTWADYMVIRDGRRCKLSAKTSTMKTSGLLRIQHVKRGGGQTRFTVATTVRVVGSSAPPMVTTIPYTLLRDGSLRTNSGFPLGQGFTVEVVGSMQIPSVAELKAGTSRTSRFTETFRGKDAAIQRQLANQLKAGAKAFSITATVKVGAAPQKKSITTADGQYGDIVGFTTSYEHLAVRGVADGQLKQSLGQVTSAMTNGKTAVYYARNVGPIQSVAMGVPITSSGCSG